MPGDLFLLLARVLLAQMFLSSGYSALSNIGGTAGYFAGLGLPGPLFLALAVGIFETVAGLLIVIGLQTPFTAAVLTLFSIAASFLGHYGQDGEDAALAFLHRQALIKDIAVAGGLIVLALHGAGRWSLDHWLKRRGRT